MAAEVHSEGATNGNLKTDEVEGLGELKGAVKPLDPKGNLAAAGDVVENCCQGLAEKEEPLAKVPVPNKLKDVVIQDDTEENADDPRDEPEFSSEEEADAETGDARDVEGEAYEEEDDSEEYVDDGEDDEGDDEDGSEPPSKRRK